jgi:hypothetical protein
MTGTVRLDKKKLQHLEKLFQSEAEREQAVNKRIQVRKQCCGSGSSWIRIKFGRKDPHPHQSDKLDQDPLQFADDKPKCME